MPLRPRLTPAIADARRAVRECFQLPNLKGSKRVLLAVSGGPDSMALALAAGFELPKIGIELSAAIVNHNLQEASGEIAAQTAERLRGIGIHSVVLEIEVPPGSDGPEAAAREARYCALERHRQEVDADFILLGHNLNDQAETVFLGLTRGSGLRSIAGMATVDEKLVRPFLALEKSLLATACSDSRIEYWEDPHNQDDVYTRVRIRKLMHTIESELGSGITQGLVRTAQIASEVDEYLSLEAQELISSATTAEGYSVLELGAAHPALRNKALRLVCDAHGARSVSSAQVKAIAELITNWHGQKPLSLSGITVERVRDQILFRQSS